MNIDFVILAAGKGTRMGGDSPKVLARLAGKPMLQNLINTTQNFKHSKRIIVVGYKSDLVKSTIKTTKNTDTVIEGMADEGFLAGIKYDDNHLLIAVTEKRTKKELDNYVDAMKKVLNE